MRDGHSVHVTFDPSVDGQPITEAYLRSLKPSTVPLLDWVGAIPRVMPNAKISGTLLDRRLDQELGAAAAGMPPLTFEQASVYGSGYLSAGLLEWVLRKGAYGHFVPAQAAWSYGNGSVSASWRITWERLHG
jgi:hypothetical protein